MIDLCDLCVLWCPDKGLRHLGLWLSRCCAGHLAKSFPYESLLAVRCWESSSGPSHLFGSTCHFLRGLKLFAEEFLVEPMLNLCWTYVEPILNCASTGCTSRLTLLRAGHVDSTSKAEPLQEIWACGGGSIVKFETAGDSECFSTKLQDVVVTTMFHSSESISKSDLPNTISFMMRTSDCLWLLRRHLQVPHHFQQTHALAISLLREGAHWFRGQCQDYGIDLVLSCTGEIYWFSLHVSNSINIIK